MEKLLNQLIQLQELYFALEEHKISGKEQQLEQLEQSIKLFLGKLPPDVSDYFLKLQKRNPPAIAPVVNQTCYGCGIALPISLRVEVLHYDNLYQCPNCARYLYPYQGGKLHLHDLSLQHKLPRLGIEKFSSEKLMLPQLTAKDQEGIISEMANAISNQLYFPHPQTLIDQALRRESIISTAVDKGLAFPHVRGVDAGSLTLALGLKKKGIKFGAPGKHLTKIFFFIIIPIAASPFYLKLLAGLIETFQSAQSRRTLLSCGEPSQLWQSLKQLTKKYIP